MLQKKGLKIIQICKNSLNETIIRSYLRKATVDRDEIHVYLLVCMYTQNYPMVVDKHCLFVRLEPDKLIQQIIKMSNDQLKERLQSLLIQKSKKSVNSSIES